MPTKQHLSFLLRIIRIREKRKIDFFSNVTSGLIKGGVIWLRVLRSVSMRLFYVLEKVKLKLLWKRLLLTRVVMWRLSC